MTERVSRDPEILAAWPQRGVCWKVVRRDANYDFLYPAWSQMHHYERWGELQVAKGGYEDSNAYIPNFHCFQSIASARSYWTLLNALLSRSFAVVEFEYELLCGIGHIKLAIGVVPVLLCDRIRPRSWVTLPGCEVAQPAEMAVKHG